MSTNYKFRNPERLYFISFSVMGWHGLQSRGIWVIFSCFAFLYSCNKKADLNQNILYFNDNKLHKKSSPVINQIKKQSEIEIIISKIEKKEKLSLNEYDFFSNYALDNNNESFSENTGYLLFKYFIDNKINVKNFKDYLITKDAKFKDKLLVYFVQLMCIDLADESYNYEKLIKDFNFFQGNLKVKKSFKECINNY